MNKISIIVFLVACLLWSCGSDYYAENIPSFKPCFFVTSDRYSGDVTSIFTPREIVYVNQKQVFKIHAGLKFENDAIAGDTIYNFIESIGWEIDGKTYNISSIRLAFAESGHKTGSFYVIDFWGDTSRVNFDIYVNTPSVISLSSPYDGYNQVIPNSNEGLPLQWNISGLDEWESASCEIYAHRNQDSLWNHPAGNVDCSSNKATLKGILAGVTNEEIFNTSYTYYWAIKATISNGYGPSDEETSEIFHFSTKILNGNLSGVTIPFTLEKYKDKATTHTEFTFVNALGDTIGKAESDNITGSIHTQLPPQSGITVYVREKSRKEYREKTLKLDLPPNTVLVTDTVALEDNIQPQAAPTSKSFSIKDSIAFYAYDDGSGLNPAILQIVHEGSDTALEHTYKIPYIRFAPPSDSNFRIRILGEDFAGNKFPDVYWLGERKKDTIYISGPFFNGGI